MSSTKVISSIELPFFFSASDSEIIALIKVTKEKFNVKNKWVHIWKCVGCPNILKFNGIIQLHFTLISKKNHWPWK